MPPTITINAPNPISEYLSVFDIGLLNNVPAWAAAVFARLLAGKVADPKTASPDPDVPGFAGVPGVTGGGVTGEVGGGGGVAGTTHDIVSLNSIAAGM